MLSVVRRTVSEIVKVTITKPSDRDKQRRVGPSDLSNSCDVCVAEAFRASFEPRDDNQSSRGFSLKAWSGTAVHAKLERDMPLTDSEAMCEERVYVHTIPGYGDISGTIDLYLPYLGTWVDYKTTDMSKLRTFRLDKQVPSAHQRQTMMYGYGLRQAGRKADYASLVYIPRDSNRLDDIWTVVADYHESIALESLERAERIWKMVEADDTSELSPDPNCFPCNRMRYKF